MTAAFPSQRLKIRFLPAVPGTDSKGSAIAAKFWFDQAKIQADIALQANETKVDKAGSVMTGPLTLYGDPTSDPVAATKHYADTKVAKAGDSMSGFLTLNADPTATLHAATKAYTDTKVPFTGGTMTGTLVLNGSPVGPNDAATKQYVDSTIVTEGNAVFQAKDPDLSSIAANTTSGTWLFRRGDGDWAPVVIGDGLSFDTINGQLQSVGGGGGGGTGDVSASDGPVLNQLALWIGSNTIKGINVGKGLQLTTAGATESLEAIGSVKINGTPTPGQYATWFDATTIQGTNLDGDLAALAALTGVNTIYYRSAADTWSPVVISTGLSFSGGNLTATGSINIVPTPAVGQTAQWSGPASLKGVQVHTASPTAPVAPVPGNFWFDTTTGVLAVYVDDGNSQQWIQVAPSTGNIASNSSFIQTRVFTSSSVYVPTPGTQFATIECIGGGGGGGAAVVTAGSNFVQAGGGGGGGYSRSTLTAAQMGASQAVTVGAGGPGGAVFAVGATGTTGGQTSFGALCVANGGLGGTYSDQNSYPAAGAGAPAGIGDMAAAGTPGGWGFLNQSNSPSIVGLPGNGGAGPLGGGAPSILNPQEPATGYGGGGSGGAAFSSPSPGGAGSPGIVIITEYNIGAGQQGPQGLAGGVTTPLTPQGRLTLQSATPVMTTTQAAKTTIFYSPYCGNQVPIWSGSSWATTSFNELSAVTTDTTKSPAAIGVSKVNDWFVWNDAGTLRLGHGPDWASDTARAATLTRQNGIWVNTAAITNGAPAGQGTYVGTTRSNASRSIDWIYGGAQGGGLAAWFGVWNCYNRVNVISTVSDTTLNWVYAASPPRSANGSVNNRASFVLGLSEDTVRYTYLDGAGGSADAMIGIGLNSTTSMAGSTAGYSNSTLVITLSCGGESSSLIGFNFVQAMEACPSVSSGGTFYGALAAQRAQGLTINLRM